MSSKIRFLCSLPGQEPLCGLGSFIPHITLDLSHLSLTIHDSPFQSRFSNMKNVWNKFIRAAVDFRYQFELLIYLNACWLHVGSHDFREFFPPIIKQLIETLVRFFFLHEYDLLQKETTRNKQ